MSIESWLISLAFWLGAYVLGSIPSGLLLTRLLHGVDVRTHGSGNIGSANVYRTAGVLAGALTLVFDTLKGLLPVLAAGAIDLPLWAVLATGAAAVVGHNWSIFLRGKGGKGIATSLGVLFGIAPVVAGVALLIWVVVVMASRYASLASLLMIGSVPVTLAVLDYHQMYLIFGTLLVALAIYRHRVNIMQLINGTELKISDRSR